MGRYTIMSYGCRVQMRVSVLLISFGLYIVAERAATRQHTGLLVAFSLFLNFVISPFHIYFNI